MSRILATAGIITIGMLFIYLILGSIAVDMIDGIVEPAVAAGAIPSYTAINYILMVYVLVTVGAFMIVVAVMIRDPRGIRIAIWAAMSALGAWYMIAFIGLLGTGTFDVPVQIWWLVPSVFLVLVLDPNVDIVILMGLLLGTFLLHATLAGVDQ